MEKIMRRNKFERKKCDSERTKKYKFIARKKKKIRILNKMDDYTISFLKNNRNKIFSLGVA